MSGLLFPQHLPLWIHPVTLYHLSVLSIPNSDNGNIEFNYFCLYDQLVDQHRIHRGIHVSLKISHAEEFVVYVEAFQALKIHVQRDVDSLQVQLERVALKNYVQVSLWRGLVDSKVLQADKVLYCQLWELTRYRDRGQR